MAATRAPHEKATMTGAQFQALRVRLGLTVRALARLLDCSEQTIRNIESPRNNQPPGRQTQRMMQWLAHPGIRAYIEEMQENAGVWGQKEQIQK